MTETNLRTLRTAKTRWNTVQLAVERLSFALLLAPPLWLLFNWPWISKLSPHLAHGRLSLWSMPAYTLAVYLLLGESGLLARMDILRPTHRLFRLRPAFVACCLALRLELLVFLAGLSFAMDRNALTGQGWSAKSFTAAALTIIVLTTAAFVVATGRKAYTLAHPAA